jgi:hypothetical protein
LLASREQASDLAAKIVEGSFQNSAPRIEDNSPVLRKEVELGADGLSHAAFQAVARYGFTQSARHSEADSGRRRIGDPETESCKISARHTETGFIDLSKLRRPEDPPCFRKRQRTTTKSPKNSYLAARTASSSLTVSLWRPLARRRASTARPSAVFIRTRNP